MFTITSAKFVLKGRALRHALDAKVRKLRAMVSADEDITTELDKVVCRLMKLALRTSKSRTCAPPPKWMQYKLLDLLTLTEKTIAKRKQFSIQGSPLKAIGFGQAECLENISISKFKNDTTAAEILNKYRNIMSFSDIDIGTAPLLDNAKAKKDIEKKLIINEEIKLERTQAWVEEKNQVHVVNFPFTNERTLPRKRLVENEIRLCSNSKRKRKMRENKISEIKLKKVLPTGSSSSSFVGKYRRYLAIHERRQCPLKSQKRIKDHKILQSTASKPIPGSIIDLCHPELTHKNFDYTFKDTVCNNVEIDKTYTNNANTEESLLVDIVMDDTVETNIGTYDEKKSVYREQEAILNSVMNAAKNEQSDKILPETENFESHTIFIYDINEPSTSKGVRHVSMECGTDPIPPSHAMPSPVSSLTKMPKIFTAGIKIEDSKMNFMKMDGTDSPPKLLTRAKSPSIFSKGIRIGDSTTNLPKKNDSLNFGTLVCEEEFPELFHANGKGIKIEDSLTYMSKKRSLDFDGSKNSEKGLIIKSGQIECCNSICCEIKKTDSNEQDIGVRSESKTGIINPFNEEGKARINSRSLEFFSGVKSDPHIKNETHEVNFDFCNSPDDNYIKDVHGGELHKITAKTYCTFSTSTADLDNNLQSIPRLVQSVGVKSKDSDTDVVIKVDCGTETVADLIPDSTPSPMPLKCTAVEKKLINPIASGTKSEDSCSEFNESSVSVMLHPMYVNVAEIGEENPSPTTHLKLSRGGIHVHSYKEKQVSEDVMYQGEWQRHNPKTNTRRTANKKAIDAALRKKRGSSKEKTQNKNLEIINVADTLPKKRRMSSRERVLSKNPEKFDNKTDHKKPVQVRRPKYGKEDNSTKTQLVKKNFVKRDVTQKSVRPIRGVVKVASKIAVSSISSKTKNTLVVKRASAMVSTVVNKDDDKKEKRLKNYIPRYLLRRKIRESQQSNFYDTIKINKSQANIELGEIQKQLTEFNQEPGSSISYIVFRNEIEGVNNANTKNQSADSVREIINKNTERNSIGKRNRSPGSPDSSTCSTSDSIATVKAVSSSKVSIKKHFTSTSKSAINSESDDNTPVKNKKIAKKVVTKKEEIDIDNKENIPETSNKFSKCSLKNLKSAFMGRSKSIFMAQVATDSATKHKDQGYRKSHIKITAIEDKKEKKTYDSPTIMKSTSHLEGEENKNQELISDISNLSQISDITDKSFDLGSIPYLEYSEDSTVIQEISNYTSKTEWFNSTQNSVRSTESSIQASMRRIVEDSLEFAFRSSVFRDELNHENTGLSNEHVDVNVEDTLSPISCKTTLQDSFNSTVLNELENSFNRSFDLETAVDSASVESFTPSLMTDNTDVFSLYSTSEYFLGDDKVIDDNSSSPNADAEHLEESVNPVYHKVDSIVDRVGSVVSKVDSFVDKVNSVVDKDIIESAISKVEPNTTKAGPTTSIAGVTTAKEQSVHGIYERKETIMNENPCGSLAVQAFSGFSMNTDRVVGDQPDYVNIIDSETGSLAIEYTRQATSEEVFVSGRSSESFQSCLMDEDAVVPNWLFNIIQQQQSVNIPVQEEDDELLLPMVVPMPMSEPIFDINGNAAEPGVGLEAGAGDGRGIHSDNSQDSSGRGTSLSSSETSSGAHSEAILIDPSAFTAQFELLQESVASSAAVTTLVVPRNTESSNRLRRTEESPIEAVSTSTARNEAASRRRDGRRYHTSDVDADVSSIDTDIPDSSDN